MASAISMAEAADSMHVARHGRIDGGNENDLPVGGEDNYAAAVESGAISPFLGELSGNDKLEGGDGVDGLYGFEGATSCSAAAAAMTMSRSPWPSLHRQHADDGHRRAVWPPAMVSSMAATAMTISRRLPTLTRCMAAPAMTSCSG